MFTGARSPRNMMYFHKISINPGPKVDSASLGVYLYTLEIRSHSCSKRVIRKLLIGTKLQLLICSFLKILRTSTRYNAFSKCSKYSAKGLCNVYENISNIKLSFLYDVYIIYVRINFIDNICNKF